jgi:acetyl esterase/lipase
MSANEQSPKRVNGFVEDRSVLTRPATPPDAVVSYGERDENIADVRYGKVGAANHPLVIFIHGGFWRPQFDRSHASSMCAAIAGAGWTTAAIEYRRIPGNPDATLEDVNLAVAKLPSLVSQHGGKIILSGHSAGGHLALWAGVKCASIELAGVLALGPVADLQSAYATGIGDHAVRAFLGCSPDERVGIDPARMPTPTTAVTLIHGIQDAIAPIALSENYAARHQGARLVPIENCGHFALIDPMSAAWPRVIAELGVLQ